MKLKTGDWCFYEYKLSQVEVEMGRVLRASDGMFSTSGQDLSGECRPLTLRNANLSQHAQYWSSRLHKEGHGGLNYPDIHRRMVELWIAACDAKESDKVAPEAMGKFAEAVLHAVRDAGEVDGVPLLRHRAA